MRAPSLARSLAARLLVLTVAFVMLAEVLIFVPSVARYRLDYFREKLIQGHLAALAVEATPDHMVTEALTRQLLDRVGALSVELVLPDRRVLMLGGAPAPQVDARYDLREAGFFDLIGQAVAAVFRTRPRLIQVAGDSPGTAAFVEVVLQEQPMIHAMRDFGLRVLGLSIVISLFTAALVFLTLNALMVRPMRRITAAMTAFRDDPEGFDPSILATERADEIGQAQRELAAMQRRLRAALRQREHLAALGTAVAKINHDLGGMLSTAGLLSERLEASEDPEVRRIAPRLVGAIDRAMELCARTLAYTREEELPLRRTRFDLRDLVDEVGAELLAGREGAGWRNGVAPGFAVMADREQLFRVLANLGRNAFESGAETVTVEARRQDGATVVTLRDDGPGLPPRARDNLFKPFAGSGRSGSTGLGLPIAREILRAHGGDIRLVESTGRGTVFETTLPDAVTP